MKFDKFDISIEKLHTTELGRERILRNLELNTGDVLSWCKTAVMNASAGSITRKGKNWYVYGVNYVLTINIRSHTVITAHRR
jgi:hypothetical protein